MDLARAFSMLDANALGELDREALDSALDALSVPLRERAFVAGGSWTLE
jgi:hypothetical protein